MNTISFTIAGNPQPKPRARKGGNKWYNPADDYMYRVSREVQSHLPTAFKIIKKNVPVIINLTFYFEPAKSQKTKKFLDLITDECYPYLKKKDFDNLAKFYTDCMSKIVYEDDSQIYESRQLKYYSMAPRTEIEIKWWTL